MPVELRAANPATPYPARLLVEPRVTASGVEHRVGDGVAHLAWRDVTSARAAEIGEPQGVRTIVFDLLVDGPDGRVALRLDADPSEDASRIAAHVAEGLGERAPTSIRSLAADGLPTCWFPDLESFEEAAARDAL